MHSPALANEKTFQINENIANWFDRQAKSIDLALSGARFTDEEEDSSATISQEAFWDETEGFEYKLDFDIDLALPNLQKKYKIMISNYNENKIRRSNYSRRNFRDDRENDYGATIAFVRKIGDFDVSFEPRLEIADPIATFYTLRLESEAERNNHIFKTRFEFFADSEKGTGQFAALTYRKYFWKKWVHSLVLEEEYQEAENVVSFLHGYTINYAFNDRVFLNQSFVLSYANQTELDDEDNTRVKSSFKLQEITIGPSFTHKLYKDEIHYSINYNYIWSRKYSFKGRNSASLIFSLIF